MFFDTRYFLFKFQENTSRKLPNKNIGDYKEMERICPRCGRDYSDDPYWTSKLRRHLERKNPCDRPSDSKYIRESKVVHHSITVLDSIIWEPKKPPKGTSNRDIVPWLFNDIFSNETNICFVQPNRSRNEIFVKVSNDSRVTIVNVDGFIQLFINHVFLKKMHTFICDDNFMFERWLTQNMIVGGISWNGAYPDRSTYVNTFGNHVKNNPDFMIHMRSAVKSFLGTQNNKLHLKNILLQL